MTANAFSSVSLDPPLVLVCVKSGAEGSDHVERNGCFAVNILGAEQEPMSRYFSSKDRPRGRDAFRDVPHRVRATGSPILDGVVAYLDCELHAAHEAGDHESSSARCSTSASTRAFFRSPSLRANTAGCRRRRSPPALGPAGARLQPNRAMICWAA